MLRGGRLVAHLRGRARPRRRPRGGSPRRSQRRGVAADRAGAAPRRRGGRRRSPRAGRRDRAARIGATIAAFLRVAGLVAHKDALVELRSRELALTTLFFAVVAVLVFAFAFVADGQAPREAPAGILWVTTLFAGTLALARAFDREQAHQTLAALLSAPVDRAAIYVGKVLGLVALLAVVLAVVIPLVGLLFEASFWRAPGAVPRPRGRRCGRAGRRRQPLCGYAGADAEPGRAAARAAVSDGRARAAGGRARHGGAAAAGTRIGRWPRMWLSILVSYDAVFVTLALWLFDAVTAED